MRRVIAITLLTASMAASASAESVPVVAPDGDIVYRLPPQEIDALLEKRANEKAAQEAEEKAKFFGRRKLSKGARIGTGVLGFLGNAAAETSRDKICDQIGSGCAGSVANNFRAYPDRTRP